MIQSFDKQVTLERLQTIQQWLLVAYAASLPLTMTGTWALLIAGLIVWAATAVLRVCKKDPHDHTGMTPAPVPLKWPLVALAGCVALSGLLNPGEHSAIGEALRSLWSLKAILVYFWASHVFHTRPHSAGQCIQALLCVSAIGGIWGTIQQVFDIHPGYKWLQGTGFLSGPMAFAGQMQLFSMLSAAILLTGAYKNFSGRLNNQYVFAAITLANLSGLVFAGERSAWLGGIAAVMVLTSMISWRLFFRSAIVMVVLATISWQTVPLIKTRVESLITGQQDVSTRVRLVIWQQAVDSWKSAPIAGVGFLNFPHLDIPEAIVPGRSKDLNHAHSNILQFLSTTGVLGLLAYLWVCLAMTVAGSKYYANARAAGDHFTTAIGAGVTAAMVSLMVSGLFEYNFGTAQVRLAQWFVLALLAIPFNKPAVQYRLLAEENETAPDSLPSV